MTSTVLYVADGEANEVAESLESRGFRVIRADDTVDAIKRLDAATVDCLVRSPAPHGRTDEQFVRTVRREDRSVPVVLLEERGTGVDDPATGEAVRYVDAGDVDRVEDEIRDAVAEREVARGLERHRRLTDRVLALATSLPDADDRRGVERAVFEALSTGDLFRFVWLCEYDAGEDRVRVRYPRVGAFDGRPALGVEADDVPEVVERAVEVGSVRTTARESGTSVRTTRDVSRARTELVTLAVPLVHEDVVHGVILLGTDRPPGGDGTERALLADLGTLVGHELGNRPRRRPAGNGENVRLERFAQELAHELRNPLGVASAHLELAHDGAGEESIDRARTAIDEIDRIVDGLLSLAAGSVELEEVDLEATATETWEAVDPPNAEFVVDESRTIEADRNLLVRMLANLFQNAVEHGSASRRATPADAMIRGSADDRTAGETADASDDEADTGPDLAVRIGALDGGFYVEDDGPGIPEGERDRIFEWGYSGAESGAGIGLAVVSTIAANHGWTIDVTEGRSGGARFEVTDV